MSRNTNHKQPDGKPNNVDIHVGSQIRARRVALGLSQKAVAESIGLTFQQVQKYENGKNRIGASRLFDICKALNVDPGYFFEGLHGNTSAAEPLTAGFGAEHGRQLLEMAKLYKTLPSVVRIKLIDIAKIMASVCGDVVISQHIEPLNLEEVKRVIGAR